MVENAPNRWSQVVTATALVGAVSLSLFGGFSFGSRKAIRERAGHRCELTGEPVDKPECMHNIHDRKYPDYNSPDNGFGVHRAVHAIDHLLRRDPSLNAFQHDMALKGVLGRMDEKEREYYDELLTNFTLEELQEFLPHEP